MMFINKYLYILGAFLLIGMTLGFLAKEVKAAEYSAQWMAQAQTVSIKTGETESIWVEIKNTGTVSWASTGNNAVKLGTTIKRDRHSAFYSDSWLSENRLTTAQQEEINPGEIGRFVFEVTAGLPPGIHKEYFGLVTEGIAWFDKFDFSIEIEVLPAVFEGEIVSVSGDDTIVFKTGEIKELSLRLKNIGDTTWRNSGAYAVKIGTAEPLDRYSVFYSESWLSKNRVANPKTDIPPGGVGEFSFVIAAPLRVGEYVEKFGIVIERLTWLKGVVFELDIKVEPAIYSASFVSQSPNPILTPGEEAVLWVDLRNEGNTIWQKDGDRTAKLGTNKPLDRSSNFYHSSWLFPDRITTIETETLPGQIGRFSFIVQAPDKIDTYTEHFRPVIEYVTWMDDLGISWEIVVNEELVLIDPIKVGLSAVTTPIIINSSNGVVIREGDQKDLIARISDNQSIKVTSTVSGYIINTSTGSYNINDYLRFVPLKNSILSVNNEQVSNTYNCFRGLVIVRRSSLSGRVWLVNELELEDYLKGIAEVPNGWPLEARKAQVIAARTFALRRIADPKADIFDIYDDTRDQVYYGYNYELNKPGIVQAVTATTGMAVIYGGQPALTYYHSDSGGATESVENAWGGQAFPYLKFTTDPWAKPVIWEATLSQSYAQNRFDDQLRKVGAVSETITDMIINERYPSGRLKTISLVTSTGKQVSMNISTFDYLTDSIYVKSMNFEVIKEGSVNAPNFILRGKGNGHGIGMSQWSAYNMAHAGQSYDQILKFFYSGVDIKVV